MSVVLPEANDPALLRIRHSLAHVMAQAVLERFPGARLGIGPAIRTGFYYDFELPRPMEEAELAQIEARMREIVKQNAAFTSRELSADEARTLFANQGFKIELIDGLAAGGVDEDGVPLADASPVPISIYEQAGFVDLCRGPHVDSTGKIPQDAFKLTHTAGAYWRGDEHRPMLTRIYGTAWLNRAQLEEYLRRVEEAQKRDHRRIGKELMLFTGNALLGSGLPIWLPRGAAIRKQLEDFILGVERRAGYSHVYTPSLARKELYEISGHWAHYKDDMFPIMEMGNEQVVLRPMNCPHHIMVYGSEPRSYRDLPVRIAELGTMYRHERSGAVSGLSRVRCMTLNDAHIFCRPDQVKEEFTKVVAMVEEVYKILGITEYSYRLSLRDPANKEKYVDNDAMWEMGEATLREALQDLGVPYRDGPGEAAFYGPKLDIQLRDVLGHEETISTVQVDFHLPNQFDLGYKGVDSQNQRPVIIHRAIVSTMERMIAYLIELYSGAFPVWLHPVQVYLVPVADRHNAHARDLGEKLRDLDLRVVVDESNDRMNAKVRAAQLQRAPYIVVIGDKEIERGTVAVRLRTGQQLAEMPVASFVELVREIVRTRSLKLTLDEAAT
jgi:threonyl-tRNA synthetase